jgi:PEGA domain
MPAPTRTGLIRVHVIPWGDVSVDGTAVATESLRSIRVSEGSHVVRVVHPDYQPLQRRVTVPADGVVTLTIDLADEAIRRAR